MILLRLLAVILTSGLLFSAGTGAPHADAKIRLVKNLEKGLVFAVPKAGPLRFAKFEADGAHFRGRVRIAGYFVYGHRGDSTQVPDQSQPSLYFVPNKKSQSVLPYWPTRGPVQEIYFTNSVEFLKAAVLTAASSQVVQRKSKSMTGEMTILIDSYVADVECDSPYYSARFVRVILPATLQVGNDYTGSMGC